MRLNQDPNPDPARRSQVAPDQTGRASARESDLEFQRAASSAGGRQPLGGPVEASADLAEAFELDSPSCDEIRSQSRAGDMEMLERQAISIRHEMPNPVSEQTSRRAFLGTRSAQNVALFAGEGKVPQAQAWGAHLMAVAMHERGRDAANTSALRGVHVQMIAHHLALADAHSNRALEDEVGPAMAGRLRETGHLGTHEVLRNARITAERYQSEALGMMAWDAVKEGEAAMEASVAAVKGEGSHSVASSLHDQATGVHENIATTLTLHEDPNMERISRHRSYADHHAFMRDVQRDLGLE